jgi:general secretion pathway protein B
MSFILDALRKAEHERDQRILPGIVDAPKAKRGRHTLRWVIAIGGALFVLNSLALLYLLMRDTRSSQGSASDHVASVPTQQPSPMPQVARPMTAPAAPAGGGIRPLTEEALAGSRAAPYTDVPPTPSSQPITAHRETAPTPRMVAEPDPATVGLPTRRQLPPAVASALPPISVDLHVYSPVPAQRFMVISGQRAQEGATIAGGIVIEKITPDGAIAVFRGTRFLLTRE